MKCPHCKKQTSEMALKCVYCGRVVRKTLSRAPHHAVRCPRCKGTTDIISLGGVELDLCRECRGIWFDKGEIKSFENAVSDSVVNTDIHAVLKELHRQSKGFKNRVYINCPICKQQMTHKNYAEISGIIFDRCKDHGTWVDHNEAIRLVELMADDLKKTLLLKAERYKNDEIKYKIRQLEIKQNIQANEV